VTPACVIVTAVPAMARVAVRALAAVFAATVATMVEVPVPPESESVTHPWSEVAAKEHPDCVVTVTSTVPLLAATEAEVGATL
jgi:hypothetical protein